jgi:CelD/BcsL family acetyltransferase involved in cellulose biosynthesis
MLHAGADAIGTRMPAFIAMHLRQWMPRPDRGLTFDTEEFLRFYPGAVVHLADAGLLALAELTLAGKPLAFHLGFIFRETFWCYRTTFDVAARRHSPGHLLHQDMIRSLAEAGYRTLDFMRGDFAFKQEYADHVVCNRRIVVEPTPGTVDD